ncbi:hypothetical protein Rsub_11458 [Raphidocelis subcapitata]|uniref:Plastid lipid-associated protein/fibrillin conserved domain-containing protein n=1 Tax=Raphidocelis subcapitata TaxID=307507 RepID=A0A2V0PG82_9CHLO|nr:hypothetical protein Rsub_11458 [Raphidocelis subcapitata]|eukprot:GBF98854.1 hypothetical protein Rsub_11458 [Raphidocelis subcapitata]
MLSGRTGALPASTVCRRAGRGSRLPVLAFFGGVNLFGGAKMSSKSASIATKKQELLDYIAPLQRGVAASPEQAARVEEMAAALERLNPTPSPLASPLLNGRWRLEYTTSQSILGTNKPAFLRPSGPIYQFIDGPGLRAKNQETAPFYNSVTAELSPMSKSKVAVQFKQFKIFNLLPVTAPPSARGELEVTFLDDSLRVSRGDKGNLFILVQSDSSATF